MQALSLGFDEDDDEDDEFIDYDPSTYVEEEEVIAAQVIENMTISQSSHLVSVDIILNFICRCKDETLKSPA